MNLAIIIPSFKDKQPIVVMSGGRRKRSGGRKRSAEGKMDLGIMSAK